jgi:hypothetical protein
MIGMLYRNLKLLGSWTVRVATLVLPREQVAAMLPSGLVLGPQRLTPRGTHPLRLSFATPFAARMTHWPPGFLGMHDYREHVIGIPFVYRSGTPAYGPFYFMPRLLLDNAGSALGGNMFWGFEKELCQIECRPGLFRARDLFDGHPLLELRWQPNGRWRPAQEARNFRPSMNITDQPLVFRTLWNANFTHYWSTAMVRSVRSRVEIREPYVPHMPVGRFDSAGLRSSVNGSYELRVTWATSLPYYPEVRPLLQALGSEVF